MDDAGRRTVERFWEAFNNRDLSLLDVLFSPDYVNHAALPGTPPGPAGQAQLMQRLWTAFPDARFEIEDLAQMATRSSASGRCRGPTKASSSASRDRASRSPGASATSSPSSAARRRRTG